MFHTHRSHHPKRGSEQRHIGPSRHFGNGVVELGVGFLLFVSEFAGMDDGEVGYDFTESTHPLAPNSLPLNTVQSLMKADERTLSQDRRF